MNYKIVGNVCRTCVVVINYGDDSMCDINDAVTARRMRERFTLGLHRLTGGRTPAVTLDPLCAHDDCDCEARCDCCGQTSHPYEGGTTGPFYPVQVDTDSPTTPTPVICPETGWEHLVPRGRGGLSACHFCGSRGD